MWRMTLLIGLGIAAALVGGCAAFSSPRPHTETEPAFSAFDPKGEARPIRLAIALSSGTMRGYAHVGVLRELRAQGIEPDLIVGTSAGAFVGALVASGTTDQEIRTAVEAIGGELLRDVTTPRYGLLDGRSIHAFIDQHARWQANRLNPFFTQCQ